MNLQTILDGLNEPNWTSAPEQLLRHRGAYTLTKPESKKLSEQVRVAVKGGDGVGAANALYAGLTLDHDRFLARVRKDGLLRISKCDFESTALSHAVRTVLKPGLGLPADTVGYLRSVSNLHEVAVDVRAERQQLLDCLEEEREVCLKSLLATLDLLFLTKATRGIATDKTLHSRNPFFYDAEELAEGFSTLLALYGEHFGEPRLSPGINRAVAGEGHYLYLLIGGAHIAAFREWETLVDRFGYTVSFDPAQKTYRLEPPDVELERAIRLGFIQTHAQGMLKGQQWIEDGTPWLRDVAEKVAEEVGDDGAWRVSDPDRIVIGLPEGEVMPLVLRDAPFFYQEEQLALLQASRDLLTPVDKLLDMPAAKGLTFHDVLMGSRLIQFLRWYRAHWLLPIVESEPAVVLESIIPHYPGEAVVNEFARVLDRDKAAKLVEFLTMRLDRETHLDVQYQPILAAGTGAILATNISANSNGLRNLLCLTRQRLYDDGVDDPLPETLAELFRSKGWRAKSGEKYQFGPLEGDIDVFVLVDGTLFALECKRSLLPAGPHELLTSFTYVHDAVEQLDRFAGGFADPRFREYLARKLGWPIDGATRLVTGIIMANRMFMGLREHGHPVRGSYELSQFVETGTVSMGEEERCFWAGTTLTGEDLRRYFEDDITYKPLWDAMSRFHEVFRFASCSLEHGSYKLNLLDLARRLDFTKTAAAIEKMIEEDRERAAAQRAEMRTEDTAE